MNRLTREHKTICAMVRIYCKDHHKDKHPLCDECKKVIAYAQAKLQKCPFQEQKPTCGNCTIHCYKKDMRARIQGIMRYSGPRMIWKHPVMAIQHFLDGFRKVQSLRKRNKKDT